MFGKDIDGPIASDFVTFLEADTMDWFCWKHYFAVSSSYALKTKVNVALLHNWNFHRFSAL